LAIPIAIVTFSFTSGTPALQLAASNQSMRVVPILVVCAELVNTKSPKHKTLIFLCLLIILELILNEKFSEEILKSMYNLNSKRIGK
jgi:hypothetical protein